MLQHNRPSFFHSWRGYCCLAAVLTIVCILSCALGSAQMQWRELLNGLLFADGYEIQTIIIYQLRLPRIIAGVLAGVGLSVSGVLLQSVTGNDLAGPNIIGVNAGAGFGCIFLLVFLPELWFAMPFVAFIGAFLTTLLITAIAKSIRSTAGTVILSGIAFTAMLNAGISFMSLLDSDVLASYNAFSIGGLNGVEMTQLVIPAIIILLSLTVCLIVSKDITLLCLGDTLASSLGVRTGYIRTVCLICASASAAAVVSFAGLLGFIGLVVPHIARRLCRNNIFHLLINSALVGAIIVVLADLLGRTLLAPTEIPVGILMAFIGIPFFFALLYKGRRVNA